ncbi:hypothetical protein DIPPA_01460 [Diplonema papillatum]|nr:hypothetical protein DIPPA_01460 [Diplonema papillatum]
MASQGWWDDAEGEQVKVFDAWYDRVVVDLLRFCGSGGMPEVYRVCASGVESSVEGVVHRADVAKTRGKVVVMGLPSRKYRVSVWVTRERRGDMASQGWWDDAEGERVKVFDVWYDRVVVGVPRFCGSGGMPEVYRVRASGVEGSVDSVEGVVHRADVAKTGGKVVVMGLRPSRKYRVSVWCGASRATGAVGFTTCEPPVVTQRIVEPTALDIQWQLPPVAVHNENENLAYTVQPAADDPKYIHLLVTSRDTFLLQEVIFQNTFAVPPGAQRGRLAVEALTPEQAYFVSARLSLRAREDEEGDGKSAGASPRYATLKPLAGDDAQRCRQGGTAEPAEAWGGKPGGRYRIPSDSRAWGAWAAEVRMLTLRGIWFQVAAAGPDFVALRWQRRLCVAMMAALPFKCPAAAGNQPGLPARGKCRSRRTTLPFKCLATPGKSRRPQPRLLKRLVDILPFKRLGSIQSHRYKINLVKTLKRLVDILPFKRLGSNPSHRYKINLLKTLKRLVDILPFKRLGSIQSHRYKINLVNTLERLVDILLFKRLGSIQPHPSRQSDGVRAVLRRAPAQPRDQPAANPAALQPMGRADGGTGRFAEADARICAVALRLWEDPRPRIRFNARRRAKRPPRRCRQRPLARFETVCGAEAEPNALNEITVPGLRPRRGYFLTASFLNTVGYWTPTARFRFATLSDPTVRAAAVSDTAIALYTTQPIRHPLRFSNLSVPYPPRSTPTDGPPGTGIPRSLYTGGERRKLANSERWLNANLPSTPDRYMVKCVDMETGECTIRSFAAGKEVLGAEGGEELFPEAEGDTRDRLDTLSRESDLVFCMPGLRRGARYVVSVRTTFGAAWSAWRCALLVQTLDKLSLSITSRAITSLTISWSRPATPAPVPVPYPLHHYPLPKYDPPFSVNPDKPPSGEGGAPSAIDYYYHPDEEDARASDFSIESAWLSSDSSASSDSYRETTYCAATGEVIEGALSSDGDDAASDAGAAGPEGAAARAARHRKRAKGGGSSLAAHKLERHLRPESYRTENRMLRKPLFVDTPELVEVHSPWVRVVYWREGGALSNPAPAELQPPQCSSPRRDAPAVAQSSHVFRSGASDRNTNSDAEKNPGHGQTNCPAPPPAGREENESKRAVTGQAIEPTEATARKKLFDFPDSANPATSTTPRPAPFRPATVTPLPDDLVDAPYHVDVTLPAGDAAKEFSRLQENSLYTFCLAVHSPAPAAGGRPCLGGGWTLNDVLSSRTLQADWCVASVAPAPEAQSRVVAEADGGDGQPRRLHRQPRGAPGEGPRGAPPDATSDAGSCGEKPARLCVNELSESYAELHWAVVGSEESLSARQHTKNLPARQQVGIPLARSRPPSQDQRGGVPAKVHEYSVLLTDLGPRTVEAGGDFSSRRRRVAEEKWVETDGDIGEAIACKKRTVYFTAALPRVHVTGLLPDRKYAASVRLYYPRWCAWSEPSNTVVFHSLLPAALRIGDLHKDLITFAWSRPRIPFKPAIATSDTDPRPVEVRCFSVALRTLPPWTPPGEAIDSVESEGDDDEEAPRRTSTEQNPGHAGQSVQRPSLTNPASPSLLSGAGRANDGSSAPAAPLVEQTAGKGRREGDADGGDKPQDCATDADRGNDLVHVAEQGGKSGATKGGECCHDDNTDCSSSSDHFTEQPSESRDAKGSGEEPAGTQSTTLQIPTNRGPAGPDAPANPPATAPAAPCAAGSDTVERHVVGKNCFSYRLYALRPSTVHGASVSPLYGGGLWGAASEEVYFFYSYVVPVVDAVTSDQIHVSWASPLAELLPERSREFFGASAEGATGLGKLLLQVEGPGLDTCVELPPRACDYHVAMLSPGTAYTITLIFAHQLVSADERPPVPGRGYAPFAPARISVQTRAVPAPTLESLGEDFTVVACPVVRGRPRKVGHKLQQTFTPDLPASPRTGEFLHTEEEGDPNISRSAVRLAPRKSGVGLVVDDGELVLHLRISQKHTKTSRMDTMIVSPPKTDAADRDKTRVTTFMCHVSSLRSHAPYLIEYRHELACGALSSWSSPLQIETLPPLVPSVSACGEHFAVLTWKREPGLEEYIKYMPQVYQVIVEEVQLVGVLVLQAGGPGSAAGKAAVFSTCLQTSAPSAVVQGLRPRTAYKAKTRQKTSARDDEWGVWSGEVHFNTLPGLVATVESKGQDYFRIGWGREQQSTRPTHPVLAICHKAEWQRSMSSLCAASVQIFEYTSGDLVEEAEVPCSEDDDDSKQYTTRVSLQDNTLYSIRVRSHYALSSDTEGECHRVGPSAWSGCEHVPTLRGIHVAVTEVRETCLVLRWFRKASNEESLTADARAMECARALAARGVADVTGEAAARLLLQISRRGIESVGGPPDPLSVFHEPDAAAADAPADGQGPAFKDIALPVINFAGEVPGVAEWHVSVEAVVAESERGVGVVVYDEPCELQGIDCSVEWDCVEVDGRRLLVTTLRGAGSASMDAIPCPRLVPNRAYKVSVRLVDEYRRVTPWSEPASAVTLPVPIVDVASVAESSALLTWHRPALADVPPPASRSGEAHGCERAVMVQTNGPTDAAAAKKSILDFPDTAKPAPGGPLRIDGVPAQAASASVRAMEERGLLPCDVSRQLAALRRASQLRGGAAWYGDDVGTELIVVSHPDDTGGGRVVLFNAFSEGEQAFRAAGLEPSRRYSAMVRFRTSTPDNSAGAFGPWSPLVRFQTLAASWVRLGVKDIGQDYARICWTEPELCRLPNGDWAEALPAEAAALEAGGAGVACTVPLRGLRSYRGSPLRFVLGQAFAADPVAEPIESFTVRAVPEDCAEPGAVAIDDDAAAAENLTRVETVPNLSPGDANGGAHRKVNIKGLQSNTKYHIALRSNYVGDSEGVWGGGEGKQALLLATMPQVEFRVVSIGETWGHFGVRVPGLAPGAGAAGRDAAVVSPLRGHPCTFEVLLNDTQLPERLRMIPGKPEAYADLKLVRLKRDTMYAVRLREIRHGASWGGWQLMATFSTQPHPPQVGELLECKNGWLRFTWGVHDPKKGTGVTLTGERVPEEYIFNVEMRQVKPRAGLDPNSEIRLRMQAGDDKHYTTLARQVNRSSDDTPPHPDVEWAGEWEDVGITEKPSIRFPFAGKVSSCCFRVRLSKHFVGQNGKLIPTWGEYSVVFHWNEPPIPKPATRLRVSELSDTHALVQWDLPVNYRHQPKLFFDIFNDTAYGEPEPQWQLVFTTAKTCFFFEGLTAATHYSIAVRAESSYGRAVRSNTLSFTTHPPAPQAAGLFSGAARPFSPVSPLLRHRPLAPLAPADPCEPGPAQQAPAAATADAGGPRPGLLPSQRPSSVVTWAAPAPLSPLSQAGDPGSLASPLLLLRSQGSPHRVRVEAACGKELARRLAKVHGIDGIPPPSKPANLYDKYTAQGNRKQRVVKQLQKNTACRDVSPLGKRILGLIKSGNMAKTTPPAANRLSRASLPNVSLVKRRSSALPVDKARSAGELRRLS